MPYWRLSSFYFFYFAVLGALVPYWGLYLKSLGYSALEIGQLMAIPMATKVIAPNLWGWLGDHFGHRMKIVQLASLASVMIFTTVFVVEGFWQLALAMVFFSFFWNASLPQFEVTTLAYLGERVGQYSRVRVWGSVGFILAVILLGYMIDRWGIATVPVMIFFIYLAIWLASMSVPEVEAHNDGETVTAFLDIVRQPTVLAFLLAAFLMQFSHGGYYAFFSIYMEETGYAKSTIGQFWALGVIAEVLVFIYMHHLLKRFGAARVIIFSLLLAVVRWLIIGWLPTSVPLLLLAQVFHAATFGTFHAAAIHTVHRAFRGKHQGKGQALYSSLSFGLGGALGSLMSGYLWDTAGAQITFSISAVIALLAVFVVWLWRDPRYD